MWKYRSPIGTIYIVYLPELRRYGTVYDGTVRETCDKPEANADNVYMQCTGCYDWDSLDISRLSVPTGLSDWTYSPR